MNFLQKLPRSVPNHLESVCIGIRHYPVKFQVSGTFRTTLRGCMKICLQPTLYANLIWRQDLRQNERPVLGSKYVLGSLIMVPQLNLDPYISCGAIARLPKTCLLPKTSGSFCLKFVSKLGLYTK